MVIGLFTFTVGTAKADGAWVLWASQYMRSSDGEKIYNDGHWEIDTAYPTYGRCLRMVKDISSGLEETGFTIILNEASLNAWKEDKDGVQRFKYICLPESVDPRK